MSSCEPECICCCLPCIGVWACIYFTCTGIISGSKYCFNKCRTRIRSCTRGGDAPGDGLPEMSEDRPGEKEFPPPSRHNFSGGRPSHGTSHGHPDWHDDSDEDVFTSYQAMRRGLNQKRGFEGNDEDSVDDDVSLETETATTPRTSMGGVSVASITTQQPAPTPVMIQIPPKAVPTTTRPGSGERQLVR